MTEEELVRLCKQEDARAKSVLYELYATGLKSICRRYAADEKIAEDWLHDSYIKVYSSIGNFTWKGEGSLSAWMESVVRNYCIQQLRHRIVFVDIDTVADICMMDEPEPMVSNEILLQFLSQLSDKQRIILNMYAIDGMSHKEIGEVLGISDRTSSSELSRARKKLSRIIRRHYYIERIKRFGMLSVCAGAVMLALSPFLTTRESKQAIQGGKVLAKDSGSGIMESAEDGVCSNNAVRNTQSIANKQITRPLCSVNATIPCDTVILVEFPDLETCMSEDSISGDSIQKELLLPDDYAAMLREAMEGDSIVVPVRSESRRANFNGWRFGIDGSTDTYAYNFANVYKNDYYYVQSPNGTFPPKDPNYEGEMLAKRRIPRVGPDIPLIDNSTNHRSQTVGISVQKDFTCKIALETGLTYTFLSSDVHMSYMGSVMWQPQSIQYLGIPLRLKYTYFAYKRWESYIVGGSAMELCTYAHQGEYVSRVHPVQFSLQGGVGLQFNITPHFGFYVEPGIHYYFDNKSGFETLRTETPCMFNLHAGIRLR